MMLDEKMLSALMDSVFVTPKDEASKGRFPFGFNIYWPITEGNMLSLIIGTAFIHGL